MPVALILNEEKLANTMAKLDSIQHPKGLAARFARPPIHPPNMIMGKAANAINMDKLPELNSKALTNYNILKGRVETPTSKLVSKYKSQNNDRFANLSRLSAETAPGALQTVPNTSGAIHSNENSPGQSRVVSPSSPSPQGESHSAAKRREMTLFRTSKQLKQVKKDSGKKYMYRPSFNHHHLGLDKFQMLRSKSFANDIHEEDNEDVDNNNAVKLTIQDLNEFSQRALTKERISQQEFSPMKTSLYNSFVDVKKYKRFVRDPEPPSHIHDYIERKYINYCDDDKSIQIQDWLIEVNKIQKKEGYWTEVIDKSLIRQQIPKHSSAEMKEMKGGNSNAFYMAVGSSSALAVSNKLNRLKAEEMTELNV